MHLSRNILLAAALTALAAGSAFACPHRSTRAAGRDSRSALSSVPQRVPDARAGALVAWRPRAWTLAAPSLAQGMRVAIDPIDAAMGMPRPDQLQRRQLVVGDASPRAAGGHPNGGVPGPVHEHWTQ